MADKSEYELERDRNMAENAQHLAALGIEPLVKPKKRVTAPKPKKKKPAAPLKPARASGRLAGKPLADEASLFAALDGALADADAEKDEAYEQLRFEQAYRASKKPRLSAAQSAELHALEAAAPGAAPAATSAVGYVGTPLTAAELAAAEQAADNLANGAVHGGLKGAERMEFLKKGQYWGAARALLRASGVRRPAWLDDLEAFLPRTSKTTMSQENRDQTMFALERACAGLGLSWKALPEGEGLFLGRRRADAATPTPQPPTPPPPAAAAPVEPAAGRKGKRGRGAVAEVAEASAAADGPPSRRTRRGRGSEPSSSSDASPSAEAAVPEAAAAPAAAAAAEARPVPRALTLGSCSESLKREGQRLEFDFGKDSGNGWAYNHAMGKFRQFQAHVLETQLGYEEDDETGTVFRNPTSVHDEEQAAEDEE